MIFSEFFSKKNHFFDSTTTLNFAVAKNKSGSAIGWQIAIGKARNARLKIKSALKKKGYENIFFQSGHEEFGHFLNRGFWVVVKSKRSVNGQSDFVSYGMGGDLGSYEKAEERALLNLKYYDKQWNEAVGYRISKTGVF